MISTFRYCVTFIACLVFFSCSLQKKRYSSGYHLQHAGAVKRTIQFTGPITAAKNGPAYILDKDGNENTLNNCDTVFFWDGMQIKAKVLQVSSKEVKYKMCDTLDGIVYIAKVKDVSRIGYGDGHTRSFAPGDNSNVTSETLPDSCVTIIRKNEMRIRARIHSIDAEDVSFTYCNGHSAIQKLGKLYIAKILTDNGKDLLLDNAIYQDGKKVKPLSDSCVTIIRKNGTRIRARIYVLTHKEVTYGYCGSSKTVEKLETVFISKILTDNGNDILIGKETAKTDQTRDEKFNELAILSLIFGILSFIIFIPSIPAIICGIIALKQISENRGQYRGTGLAIAGIVLGCLALIVLMILLVALGSLLHLI